MCLSNGGHDEHIGYDFCLNSFSNCSDLKMECTVFGNNPNVHAEPNGITWSLAASNCGDNGLESDEDVMKRSNFTSDLKFWIGMTTDEIRTDSQELGMLIGVLQRKLRVVTDFKSENSVITNIIHVMPNSNSLLQFEERFSPRHWFKCDQTSKNKAIGDILIIFQQEDVAFCKFRNQFIEEQLEVVRDGFTVEDGNIDWNCNPHDRYNFVTSGHPDDKIKVVMGHPCFENPCSFKSVEKVFDHIENLTKSNRKWTILGCDAPPYTIGNKVIGNHMVCIDCEIEFEEEEAFLEHIKDRDHCLSTPIENCRKYNNIFIFPGGKDLDKDFINMSQKDKEHRRQHFLWLHDKSLGTKKKYEPFFVLPEDRANYEDVSNKMKAEISKLVEEQLKSIGDQKLNKTWTKIKRKTKADFLTFRIQSQVEDVS
ncbi:unnamed protein product [Mytilus coruscus]|uniref:C2H2-type domain-containing protein n=1 Tax=Mytilus coruscus TaxID=42192 RepID=A0A6J8CX87_MYTCO|nr:unnamed protein product [Mytilus coruscus]